MTNDGWDAVLPIILCYRVSNMSRIVLVHGFAVGLTAPIVRRGFGASASFRAFDAFVERGEAAVFRWGIECHVKPWQLMNLIFLHGHYLGERALAMDPATIDDVKTFLEKERPRVVVAH